MYFFKIQIFFVEIKKNPSLQQIFTINYYVHKKNIFICVIPLNLKYYKDIKLFHKREALRAVDVFISTIIIFIVK